MNWLRSFSAAKGADGDDDHRVLRSINRSQAVIEFTPSGEILAANPNFLQTLGYELDEIVGRHHRMFVDPVEADTERYREFWAALARGEFHQGEYRRLGRAGHDVWIQATYNPILNDRDEVYKVVKLALDITGQKVSQREIQNRSQAVIEFEPDGTILAANDNFLAAVGYSLDQIRGQHHRMFMDADEASSDDYQASGRRWLEANSGRATSIESTPTATSCGFGAPTVRSSTQTARWSGWSRPFPTSPNGFELPVRPTKSVTASPRACR